jgi:DNA-binding transcriptional regulator YbjK
MIFDIDPDRLQAVVEAAEEALKRGGVSIAGHTPSVVMGPGTG